MITRVVNKQATQCQPVVPPAQSKKKRKNKSRDGAEEQNIKKQKFEETETSQSAEKKSTSKSPTTETAFQKPKCEQPYRIGKVPTSCHPHTENTEKDRSGQTSVPLGDSRREEGFGTKTPKTHHAQGEANGNEAAVKVKKHKTRSKQKNIRKDTRPDHLVNR